MEPKTTALGKSLEMFLRKPPTVLRQNNHVKKRIANHSALAISAVAGACNNSVIRGFRGDRTIALL